MRNTTSASNTSRKAVAIAILFRFKVALALSSISNFLSKLLCLYAGEKGVLGAHARHVYVYDRVRRIRGKIYVARAPDTW